MSTTNKIKESGFWQSVEVIALVIVQFGYFVIMARFLEKSDFGLMAISNSIISFGSIFAESGMGAALIQKNNLSNRHINAAFQGSLLIGSILYVITFILAPFIAYTFKQIELILIIQVISLNYVVLTLSSISLGILHKKYMFKQSSMITIASVSVAYGIGIVMGFYGYGVWSLVVASLLFSTFKLIGYFYFAPFKVKYSFYLKEWNELFSFGFGMILVKTNNYIGTSGINLFLGKILSIDLLGVFERTYQLKSMPSTYLGNILDKIMFPVMSDIQDEEQRLFRVYQHSLGLVNSVLMPISALLIIFTEEIVLIMLGTSWIEAVTPLMIMFVVLPFSSSGRMADSLLRAKGLIYKNAWRKFVYVIVLLCMTSVGAIYFGIIGVAVGVTISYMFNYIYMLFLVKNIFKKTIYEIFLSPIYYGAKLTIIIIAITYTIKIIINIYIDNDIAIFIITTILIGGFSLYVSVYHPSLLGNYLDVTLKRMGDKKL